MHRIEGKVLEMLPKIILVRPRNPNNIGAVARAMNNFGFAELVVVAPYPPIWAEVTSSAVGAEDVVQNARVVRSLDEAVHDCSLVIGTMDHRRATGQSPQQLVEEGAWQFERAAIVFGSEKNGLSNEDLSYCNVLVNIPTSPNCPSMNLGQAAAVMCYEFARSDHDTSTLTHAKEPSATTSEVSLLLDKLKETLVMAGFLTGSNEEQMMMEIRASVMRVRLTRRELTLWLGALRQIRRKNEEEQRKERKVTEATEL